mmetsp:Transcript_2506/g.10531  ORF Transcript_2506/g.10531 Transcript_2506/m.10531 type:complete len:229 (-) Transcript_2506:83-769(-)
MPMPQGWHWGRLGLCEKTQVDRLAERQRREDMTHDGRQLSRAAFSIAFSNGIHGFSSIKTSPRLFPGRRSCAAAFGPCVRPRFVVGVLPRLVGSPLPVRKGKRSTVCLGHPTCILSRFVLAPPFVQQLQDLPSAPHLQAHGVERLERPRSMLGDLLQDMVLADHGRRKLQRLCALVTPLKQRAMQVQRRAEDLLSSGFAQKADMPEPRPLRVDRWSGSSLQLLLRQGC